MRKVKQSRKPPIIVYEEMKWSFTARQSSRTGAKMHQSGWGFCREVNAMHIVFH
jgi:hypothetical protein